MESANAVFSKELLLRKGEDDARIRNKTGTGYVNDSAHRGGAYVIGGTRRGFSCQHISMGLLNHQIHFYLMILLPASSTVSFSSSAFVEY